MWHGGVVVRPSDFAYNQEVGLDFTLPLWPSRMIWYRPRAIDAPCASKVTMGLCCIGMLHWLGMYPFCRLSGLRWRWAPHLCPLWHTLPCSQLGKMSLVKPWSCWHRIIDRPDAFSSCVTTPKALPSVCPIFWFFGFQCLFKITFVIWQYVVDLWIIVLMQEHYCSSNLHMYIIIQLGLCNNCINMTGVDDCHCACRCCLSRCRCGRMSVGLTRWICCTRTHIGGVWCSSRTFNWQCYRTTLADRFHLHHCVACLITLYCTWPCKIHS